MFGYLRQLFVVALLSGAMAGTIVWAIHMVGSTPLILKAEIFETAAEESASSSAADSEPSESHVDGMEDASIDGWKRNLLTFVADLLTGIGFSMLMVMGFSTFGTTIDYRRGLIWGLVGFAAFTLAPSLGLPPTLPGTLEAPLLDRQIWWLLTASATLLGIAAFVKLPFFWNWGLALSLIALPHIIGAPQPDTHQTTAPEDLRNAFFWVSLGSGLVFWLSLGLSAGALYRRIVKEPL